ncbi:MAG: DNA-processing protein DprA [Acidimicrobiia bacterium]
MVSPTHRMIGPADDLYPVGLHDLEEQPRLYLAGALDERPGVAVVGSRRCTRYGVALAEGFGRIIADSGWTVVSGLARGIDTAAHRGCLQAGGHAVAVLGSGIDVCYPRENQEVYDHILGSGGAILSEYPPGTRPDRWRFPARNRIIASISAAVVVVEASRTGGALITARLAAELGRPIFVVPGDVDRPASEGCNRLIRDGAHPVLGDTDLVEELALILGPPQRTAERSAVEGIPTSGVPLEDLPSIWGLDMSQTLVRVGRLEVEGRIRRSGDIVLPA